MPAATAPDVAELAEALHHVMCDVSHHDRPPARCHAWPKYPAIARSAVAHWPAARPPKRIQRKRTKGWRMPDGAVYVGRPTAYGNPFYVPGVAAGRQDGTSYILKGDIGPVYSREGSVAAFRAWVASVDIDFSALRGRDLVCWCPLDQPCHADVLLELANA